MSVKLLHGVPRPRFLRKARLGGGMLTGNQGGMLRRLHHSMCSGGMEEAFGWSKCC